MKKIGAILSVLMFVLMCTGAYHVYALTPGTGPMGGGGPGYRYQLFKTLIRLNLNDQQEHSIALILKKNRDEIRNLSRAMKEARKVLLDSMLADQYSEDAVRHAAKQMASCREDIAVERARVFSEIRKVLTPEQQAIVQQLRVSIAETAKEREKGRVSLVDEWIEVHSR